MIMALACMVAFSAAGCGVKATQTAATFNGQKIDMGLVNFYARYQQAHVESQSAGEVDGVIWNQSFYGNGTYELNVKGNIMSALESLLILESHAADYGVELTEEEKAAIDQAVEQFLADNDQKVLDKMTATKESVTRLLTLITIQNKVSEAMVADVDQEVSEEEANQSSYSYILAPTTTKDADGNSVNLSEEEVKALKEKLETVRSNAETTKDLESAAKEVDETLVVQNGSYGTDDTELPEPVKTVLDGLNDGEVATEIISVSEGYYVVQLKNRVDEEATKEKKQSIIDERKSNKYTEIYTEWQKEAEFKINERNWSKVNFTRDSFKTTETQAPETQDSDVQDIEETSGSTEEKETKESKTEETKTEETKESETKDTAETTEVEDVTEAAE
jgi:foldase protein PrsA